jgi:hypothetical protein
VIAVSTNARGGFFQVDLRGTQNVGHATEPQGGDVHAVRERRVVALEQRLHRAGDQIEIEVRIALPRAHVLEFDQLAIDARAEQVVVDAMIERQFGARDRAQIRARLPEPRDVRAHRRRGDEFEAAVARVVSESRRDVRPPFEPRVEEAIRQLCEAAVRGAACARGAAHAEHQQHGDDRTAPAGRNPHASHHGVPRGTLRAWE